MSLEKAEAYLREKGYSDRILIESRSTATVELAAEALGTVPGRIAKSLTFMVNDRPVMILCAGDVKVDNAKYRAFFGVKAKMLSFEQVESLIGHAVGGVCPFGINPGVDVYLDRSLERFPTVFPACGSDNSCIELTLPELEILSEYKEWIDVTKQR